MANATVVLYLVHEDYAIDRTVVLHSTVPVVVLPVVLPVSTSIYVSTGSTTTGTRILPARGASTERWV